MCGILGIVDNSKGASGLSDRDVIAMRDCMINRGPDDAGLFRFDRGVFAHRRLAIRDAEFGKQPWLSQDENQLLVYNGEIYNGRQLKNELEAEGFRLRTNCDTELVSVAYCCWGENCLSHLNGMFAFGVYDIAKRTLFLARDRFGIKPLFLAEVDGAFVFASSIAAILTHPKFHKEMNGKVLSHYLTTLRLTLGRETLYRKIYKLLPGEKLSYCDGRIVIEPYWDPDYRNDESLTHDEATELLAGHLKRSVTRRLVSDVPVGLFLSGGLDSNSLAAILNETAPRRMHAACGGGDDDSDDFRYAQECANLLGFPFRQIRVKEEAYRESWQHLLQEYRTPISTPSDVVIYELAREMKKNVGVVLGGEGADELLCGYEVQHWSAYDYEASLTSNTEMSRKLCAQYGKSSFDSFTDHYFSLNSLIPKSIKSALFQPWVWQEAQHDASMLEHYREYLDRPSGESSFQKLFRLMFEVNLEALLARLDSATMAAGLEARVPLTDHELVQAMLRVPFSKKIRKFTDTGEFFSSRELSEKGMLQSKVVLRNVAARYLPDRLVHRKKASFPTPVNSWMGHEWSAFCQEVLTQSEFAPTIFRKSALREMTEKTPEFGMMLWPILNVILWGENEFCGKTATTNAMIQPHWGMRKTRTSGNHEPFQTMR